MKGKLGWIWLWAIALGLSGFVACSDDDDDDTTADDDDDTVDDDDDDDTTADDDDDTVDDDDDTDDTPPKEMYEVPTGQLKAGVGVEVITGPVGMSMAGYGGRRITNPGIWNQALNGARGFYMGMTVKAIALEVEGERLVLMKIPTMSSSNALTDGTIRKLQDLYGLDLSGRVLMGATHSHHTLARYWRLPSGLGAVGADDPDEEVIDRISTAFARAIKKAIDDLDDAQWAHGMQDDWDLDNQVYRDRRGENNPTYGKDPRLNLFAVRRPDGTPLAVIFNFGMHGTIFDSDNELFTEDAPGGTELKFEEYFFKRTGMPIAGLFIQSGGGDASPSGDGQGHNGHQRVQKVGETAAPKIYGLYDTLEWKNEATLAVRSRRIDLSLEKMGYGEEVPLASTDGTVHTWGAWQCNGEGEDENNPETGLQHGQFDCVDVGFLVDAIGGTIPNGEVHQLYLTTARIDGLWFASLPGEPLASAIQLLRNQVDLRSTEADPIEVMAFGYSQSHYLYMPARDDWYQGGYEQDMTLWGPLFTEFVVGEHMRMLEEMQEGYNRPVFYEDSPNATPAEAFTPRGMEHSLGVGEILVPVAAAYQRGTTVAFSWKGGDPTVASPVVVLQQQDGEGFIDVPSSAGWSEESLDNHRYHMITHVRHDPPLDDTFHEERTHKWTVLWEIPIDQSTGTYRLKITGKHWDGDSVENHQVMTDPFAIVPSAQAELSGALDGTVATFSWTHAPIARTFEDGLPLTGWILMDPTVGPDTPYTVRAPLLVSFVQNGLPVSGDIAVDFEGGYSIDLTPQGIDPGAGALTARVRRVGEAEGQALEIPVTAP